MTLWAYYLILAMAVFFYLIGIAIHKEVKQTFQEVEVEMINSTNHAINRASPLSYPFFLAHKRARRVCWVVNSLFSFVTLIVLVVWFGVTVMLTIDKDVQLSDTIDVFDLFGVIGVMQPVIVYLALIVLTLYGIEAWAFNRWRK